MTNLAKAVALSSMTLACGSVFAFQLSSPDIAPNATIADKQVYKGFGCEGGNVSPALSWKAPPKGTRSFALMVHDPDAPTGGAGWWHWVVYNLPADALSLPEGAGSADGGKLPAGAAQAKTDFGTPGWGGPCPPVGDKPHHYVFTVYALKVEKIDVPEGATASLVGFMVNANAIGKATLTGRYGRRK
ncbi:MAG: YbhB/YbcL family Raf kinase inhibitor-like protein [Burkholderiales bacterium]|nr:YbhB/YbcL family Raf kinase inhibitor-like protein [Burkholderiales bacterium]OJX04080.1 MAG: phosphatidylethanolamine-binding protein [Burkholderiales bacterium 70-64]